MTKSRKNLRAVGKVALYVVGIIVAYALIVAVLSRIPFNRNTVPGVDVVAYRTVMFYVICFIAMLPWVAAEWILCKEVVRVCRDAGKRRRAKILAVITAAADIPLVCLSLYIAFGLATMFRTPNGYCFHFSAGALGLGFLIGSLPMFVIAPFSALPVGLSCFGFFCFALGSFDFTHSSVLALSAYYFLVGAFMRGKIVCGASGRSQWRAVFVFWTTYWPHVLLSIILCLAEGTADITGHCCFDW